MPPFRYHIFCCTNLRQPGHDRGCCAEKGAEALRDYFKARVKELGIADTRVNTSGCLDVCERGPAFVIYPEGLWYKCETKEDVDFLIGEHLQQERTAERLLMFKKQRNLPTVA